jgi:hypothetical protein
MKYFAKLTFTLVISLLVGALIDGAQAAPKARRHAKRVRTSVRSSSYGGNALKAKTSLKLDSRSVEALRAGKYDFLSVGDGGVKGAKRLYNLPANFQARAADSETEMRYRQ